MSRVACPQVRARPGRRHPALPTAGGPGRMCGRERRPRPGLPTGRHPCRREPVSVSWARCLVREASPPTHHHHAAAARGTCSLPSSRSRSWFALSGRRCHGELVSPASAGPERRVGDKRACGDGGIALGPSHGQTPVSCLFSLVWRWGSSWGCSLHPHPQAACPGPASPFLIIGAAGILSKRFSGGSGQA